MCGIGGVFLSKGNHSHTRLETILRALQHRGHHLYEIGSGETWAIGANRLDIVDRANGRQPFYSCDRSLSVVFNGEIYNYTQLRAELLRLGYRFLSHTDTEVLVHGYCHWGSGLFSRLDGMFAFILHDANTNQFFAVRDPVGVKPLYAVSTTDGTYIASEIKALLSFGHDIHEIPPGNVMTADGRFHQWIHWPLIEVCQELGTNAIKLRELFTEAVRKRCQTDLPLAVFLSAGIDSAAVIYEAARHHTNVVGFSIGKDQAPDVIAAKRLCSELAIPLEHITVSEAELLKTIPEVIWTIESFEPNHIRGGCLSYILSREVSRAGYRVALCGEGADELFGGYPEFGLALINGERPSTVDSMITRYIRELHKTQLKRVDRTSMRFALEVREPYLDKAIVCFARSLPLSHKVAVVSPNCVRDKRVIREAYRGILPDWVVDRRKTVLSQGAGFGSNGPEGIFYDHGQAMISTETFQLLRLQYPDFHLRNQEEAYYFTLYQNYFGSLSLGKHRPLVNATRGDA